MTQCLCPFSKTGSGDPVLRTFYFTYGECVNVRISAVTGSDGVSVYEVYTGPDKSIALEFLKDKPMFKRMYFVVVDTPEGSFGRDIGGFYRE